MNQLSLIPQSIVTWYPAKKTASKPRIGQASDGLDYVVKHDENKIPVRASEWVCASLARSVGIPVPPFIIVDDGQGKLLFASQIYGSDINNNRPIFMGNIPNSEILKQLSRIYPFDLFIHNVDRHINNYLIRNQRSIERIFAFDHGYSLFKYWPNMSLPLKSTRNTVVCVRAIKQKWGFDLTSAQELLDKLELVPLSAVESVVREMPDDWLKEAKRDKFLNWWENDSGPRIDDIRKGLIDGKYL